MADAIVFFTWVKFRNKEFNHVQPIKILSDGDGMVSVILSEMGKAS